MGIHGLAGIPTAPSIFYWRVNASSTWSGLQKPRVLVDLGIFLTTLEYFYLYSIFPASYACWFWLLHKVCVFLNVCIPGAVGNHEIILKYYMGSENLEQLKSTVTTGRERHFKPVKKQMIYQGKGTTLHFWNSANQCFGYFGIIHIF